MILSFILFVYQNGISNIIKINSNNKIINLFIDYRKPTVNDKGHNKNNNNKKIKTSK